MIVKPEQLHRHLQQELKPVYLISGDEALLMQESCDSVRLSSKAAGFIERELYDIDAKFHWEDVHHSLNSLSLFADKKVIELRFKSSKIGDGSKHIIEIVDNLSPDILLLILMPKIDKTTLNSKLCTAIDKVGAIVQIWPIERNKLPEWITQRLSDKGISASSDAIQFLADNVEGNLLAAKQEIEKIALIDHKNIDLTQMTEIISNSSRYTIFNLADRCLSGDTQAAIKTLSGLQSEGVEATLILWCLTKELRVLHRLCNSTEKASVCFKPCKPKGFFKIANTFTKKPYNIFHAKKFNDYY